MLDRERRPHPGGGSQRPMRRGSAVRGNGTNGLLVCLRVCHGGFEDDRLVDNGQFGISTGHKESVDLLRRDHVVRDGSNGVFFLDEVAGMSPPAIGWKPTSSRTTAGNSLGTAGIRVGGEPAGLTDKENVIRDTRRGSRRTQTVCILVEDWLGAVEIGTDRIAAKRSEPRGRRPTSSEFGGGTIEVDDSTRDDHARTAW